MIIISLDPGEYTGIALKKSGENSVLLRTLHAQNFEHIIPLVWLSDIILVETARGNDINPILSSSFPHFLVLLEMKKHYRIFPGHWKPVAKRLDWKVKAGQTQHEKDAYNILRYWYWSFEKVDIGDV